MEKFFGLALGLVVLGVVAWVMNGSILPFLVVLAVIWVVGRFLGGLINGNKR
jgi:hypothetical protein